MYEVIYKGEVVAVCETYEQAEICIKGNEGLESIWKDGKRVDRWWF